MIEIIPHKLTNCEICVPGSKSITHRMLITAALSNGICILENCLESEDTLITQTALKQMGIVIDKLNGKLVVKGTKGIFKSCSQQINLENSGTSMRLLAGVASMGKGKYTLTGTKRMSERPIIDLLDALNQIGVVSHCIKNNRCPPVEISGGQIKGGSVNINCSISSQYLSSLLLIAPYTQKGLEITVDKGLVSKPYVDITIDTMKKFGIDIQRNKYSFFKIAGQQIYKSGNYVVEPDCSQAGYFWAAAAITGTSVKVKKITQNSIQGDINFIKVLEKMGCSVSHVADGITVHGGKLTAIEVDMADMPDLVPTLAVIAAFAKGTTVIKNVGHLKAKESNRLDAVSTELYKMGITTKVYDEKLVINGGKPHKAKIDTYNDHRIAMSFAIAGLVVPGIVIRDEKCVEKSFPEFWNVFKGLYK